MIKKYLSLVKFSHTIFAMPFAFIGFAYGVEHVGSFSLKTGLLMLLCMVFARNSAMAFNRYVDRDIDAKNPRTASREIPSGVISSRSALLFIIVNISAFILTTYFIGRLAFILSPVAVLVICGYSLFKRFSALCHVILGFALAIAPIGAYIAVTGEFSPFVLMIGGVVVTWTSAFDILYALSDEEFDRGESLHSIPQLLGRKWALVASALLHLVTIVLLVVVGVLFLNSVIYYIGAALFSMLLIYEHVIVKPSDISKVNLAFATLNGMGSIVYSVFTILAIFF